MLLYGFTTVPLYDTLDPDSIAYVLNHSGVRCVFGSSESCKTLADTKDLGKVKTLVTFDPLSEDVAERLKERGLKLLSLDEMITAGVARHYQPQTTVRPDNIVTFSYTSGTTGPPKAVMLTHANFVACLAVPLGNKEFTFHSTDVYLSYLPLPHVMERTAVYGMLEKGAQVM